MLKTYKFMFYFNFYHYRIIVLFYILFIYYSTFISTPVEPLDRFFIVTTLKTIIRKIRKYMLSFLLVIK